MWWRSIRPRIRPYLPADTILEIAPGTGRWTAYLLDESRRFIGVDVTPACIDACLDRFAGAEHARFCTNDGETLPMVADDAVDLAISLDSLVHVEAQQLSSYLRELARTLLPGGVAFLHHSNLGAYVTARGAVASYVRERHWRAATVSAALVRRACREAGLSCISQEVINWIGRDADVDRFRLPGRAIPLTDCFTVCARRQSGTPTTVYFNWSFVDEWRQLIDLTGVYSREPAGVSGAPIAVPHGTSARPSPRWRSRVSARLHGILASRRDPAIRALRSGQCPDCASPLATESPGRLCRTCDAVFTTSERL